MKLNLWLLKRYVLSAFIWLCMGASATYGQETKVSFEYKIKAAYLFNLTKFVEWPDSTLGESIVICIYQENPFSQHLELLKERKVKGRSINVAYPQSVNALADCSMLFIPTASFDKDLFENLKNTPSLLTVGENDTFIDQGGMVSLVLKGDKVNLEIALGKAKNQGFSISGNLLEIAKKIY